MKNVNVAIVGLGFGAEFIPIYQAYPGATLVAICQRTEEKLKALGEQWKIPKLYTDYDELLADDEIDAVHINTPPQLHADMVCKALEAGKHAACTIPMALSVEDCKRIVDAQEKSGKTYMMMETTVYSREFLYLEELYRTGKLGKLQFLRGSHPQDMTGWPDYWKGFPPMLNPTHAIAPTLSLGRNQAEEVCCFGSGTIEKSMIDNYNSPFAVETTHIRFKDSDLCAEVTRSLWNVARQYRESVDVYGSKMSFEWQQTEDGKHVLFCGENAEYIEVPDYAKLLPEEIRPFTTHCVYDNGDNQHLSFVQGSGHGGSHPHLVHEFISSILEGREPYPNAKMGANITCSGILSHESALRGGEIIKLPEWTWS